LSSGIPIEVDADAELPLAAQISQQIGWLIAAGTINVGAELPSIQDLASRLGVNIHTVRAGYQRLEAQGLVTLARGRRARVLGFDRARHAGTATSVPSHTIGVIIPEVVQLYGQLLSAIETTAAQRSSLIFVATAHEDPNVTLTYVDRFIARGVDGIIVAAALLDPSVEFPTNGPSIVYVDAPGSRGVSIDFDLEHSQYLATRHLIEHGHTRIGYITPPTSLRNVAPKLKGHNRALTEAGIEPASRYVIEADSFLIHSGETAGYHLLAVADPPTAITTTTDALAVGVYQAADALGLSIPSDLAVTSNDNAELATIVRPPLTTVAAPIEEAGQLATQAIHAALDGRPFPERTILDVELIIRTSCGCVPEPTSP
jgi:DNA-binding LacI/PurR family transcriptional regulator